jgi:glutamate carboxypeptidase
MTAGSAAGRDGGTDPVIGGPAERDGSAEVTTQALDLAQRLTDRLDELARSTVALAEINSGSRHPDGVARTGARLAELVDDLGTARVELTEVGPTITVDSDGRASELPVGPALVASARPDAPFRVCLFGHLDTVFGPDHHFQTVSVDGHRLHGPGVADCKGGLVLAVEVARAIDEAHPDGSVGWDLVAVPDEEIGSMGSKALLAEVAARCQVGIGVEPALPSGGVAAARKGSLNLHVVARGVPAHVGRAHHEGRSAIRRLVAVVEELESHNDRPDLVVSCGRIQGGGPLNVVPDLAAAGFNIRVASTTAEAWIRDRLDRLMAEPDLEVVWGATRPPKERTPGLERLLADVAELGDLVGDPIEPTDTGGVCDGNDLAAAGLSNVDSLGVRGGHIHSDAEFALLDSLPARAAVVFGVIGRERLRATDPAGAPAGRHLGRSPRHR